MGLTCANIHVFLGGRHVHLQPADVGRVMDEACGRIGYEPVESDSPAESDLVAVAAESWVSVLDPRSPGIITETLAKLAGQLSAAASCPVLAAAVYDSDEFAFLVFEGGDPVDGYASQDDLLPLSFKPRSAKERAPLWNRLFGRSLDGKHVGELAQPLGLFADDRLAALCRLVGIPLEQGTLNASDFDQPTALTTRGYRLRSAAATVNGDGAVSQFVPPNVEAQYRTGAVPKPLPLMPGEETAHYVLLNGPAGAFSDPVLELFGPAIERGLVDIGYAHGEWHCGEENILAGRAPWLEAQLETERSREGERVIRARLHGLSAGQFEFSLRPQTRLTIVLRFKAVEEGVGELRARFLPSPEASEPVHLSPVFRVEVAAPSWVPLHCESYIRDREPHPQLLPHALSASREGIRLLNTPEIVSGVAILTDRGEQDFSPIPGLLERWLTFPAMEAPHHVEAIYEGQMNPRTFHIPRKKQTLRPEEIGAGKKWQKFFAKPSAIQSLFFQVARDRDEAVVAGASVQRTCEDDDVAGTIHLAFWRRSFPSREPAEADRDARQHLTSLIDSAFETMDGLQGWIARWDWIPRFSMGEENNYTPYEDAYALDSPSMEPAGDSGGYMDETWCRRYLRGLSERLWLGSPLLERIDRGPVAEIALAKEIGLASARFDLFDGVELSQLEKLLLPILPMSIE